MSTNTCPERSWCNADHTNSQECDEFHMKHDHREPGIAILRHDFVLDQGTASIDINEPIDWSIPLVQVPSFVQAMRAELNKIEAAALTFMTLLHPIVRRTEPGEPDQQGIGGGL